MEFLLYGICGIAGGLIGGMGMGGGTVLIPMLSILFGVNQHTAQGVNLISFIPMAAAALVVHLKNRLVDFKYVFFVVLPGMAACVVGCYVAKALSGDFLRRCFGGFLSALSVFQLIYQIRNKTE